ncbi:hypothetical protein [Agromyces bauzanensis]
MLISELTFPHLMADREARLARELEWRRVVEERRAEAAAAGTAAAGTAAPEAVPGVGATRRPRRPVPARASAATC